MKKTAPHLVAIVMFPGAQVLDVTGPASVFALANRVLDRAAYEVQLLSTSGGLVTASSFLELSTKALARVSPSRVHTALLVGGEELALRRAAKDATLRSWMQRAAKHCKRYGSVCSGAVLLAAFGLLDGKRATTHWDACEALSKLFPKVLVDADALYVRDGNVWTSAGVSTGIDLALAMVEHDHGADTAHNIAQRLVLHAHRPGYQSQFSPLLQAQRNASAPYASLLLWMQEHLQESLSVPDLAARAGQSVRDFHRKFTASTGQTPARFVEALRLERARALLPKVSTIKEVAALSGFHSAEQLTRAFERRLGRKPSTLREYTS